MLQTRRVKGQYGDKGNLQNTFMVRCDGSLSTVAYWGYLDEALLRYICCDGVQCHGPSSFWIS